jgi:hypothetical protein
MLLQPAWRKIQLPTELEIRRRGHDKFVFLRVFPRIVLSCSTLAGRVESDRLKV